MLTVAVWGAGSALGRRVTTRLASRPDLLTRALPAGGSWPGVHASDLAGVGALVVLGPPSGSGGTGVDGTGLGPLDLAGVRSLLGAAAEAGVGTVVAVSSATVYGAWAANPVPLTEEAPIRPPDDFHLGTSRAELERLVAGWRGRVPGSTAALLRPVVAVDRERRRELRRSVWGQRRWRARESDPPLQLLALDDLAAAVELACRERLDGPFNVAPHGWVDAAGLRQLVGRPLPVPAPLRRLARSRPRGAAAGVAPYLQNPWVVANDRLVAEGWSPTATTEEIIVEARRRRSWGSRTRQELSLAAAGGLVVGLGALGAVLLRRRRRG